ncbi:Serine/threonine-protein kinase RAD53 [Apiospora kogelbergensis]|uniref:Serine/threonine-protein kinase RAD53 n=1 Tax=Apiospora kogelbergensis TaxID=1337665 RepID=UPI00312EBAF5
MDDSVEDSQATQQATQTALDPRRLGKQNSGFSDEDISDIVCLLYANSENASREIQRIADSPEFSPHITGRYAADAIESDLSREDTARNFGRTRGLGDHAIVLKLSSTVKSPHLGFTFGRNQSRCDICFAHDPHRRLSNIHFRIYINKYGVVLLEDQSTNGTIVDDILLKKKNAEDGSGSVRRMIESGSTVKVFMHQNNDDLQFIVRVPRRDGALEDRFQQNLSNYLRGLQNDDPNRTIIAPTHGTKLMPPPNQRRQQQSPIDETTQLNTERFPREWRGGDKYSRVGVIGKGAFATVYKVTSKYNGLPYAAKELDKRKFMKNGVLDQKVENEMKIMQRVHHPNIVQYIEHFDWDTHQFFIIMEYVPGGDLGKLVQENNAITEPYVKIIARQLIDAVGYLHDNKITHRDVKPDNILIESTSPELVVKLTDFGLSKMVDTEQTFLKTFCGTLLYCAPEVYSEYSTYDENGRRVHRQNRKPINRERYDHAVDIWSLGGVLFYAITGAPPFPVKNGISYTELLHHIMTRPLDTRPLIQQNVSAEGIDFLQRMIDRRPETRATISELKAHPWLNDAAGESFDEISDDGLEQGASQLSLHDGQDNTEFAGASALLEPLPDFSMEVEEDKENYTFEGNQAAAEQLWGECGETEIIAGTEILDSFESDDFSTPRQPKPSQPRGILSSDDNLSIGNSRSMELGANSQSLGGAESILENLNMKSLARTESSLRIGGGDLNTSKRKPGNDSSDEFDRPSTAFRPSFKRIKSKEDDDSEEDDVVDELELFASIPPIIKSESARQMDYPLHKTTFWDTADRQTWHLDYPEMTHKQYAAFTEAVQKRNEDFSLGESPLWDLAMKYFPPKRTKPLGSTMAPQETQRTLLRRDSRSLGRFRDWDEPETDPLAGLDDEQASIPDTLPPGSQLLHTAHEVEPRRKTVGRFVSTPKSGSLPGSLISGISLSMVDPIMSWGRERSNTVVYQFPMESKVPKYAFRVLLWREGYNGSSDEFRPWRRSPSAGSATLRASPEPESFAFYISTKATNGLRINNNPLQPNEPKNPKAPSKYWMKLYHGDTIVFWGTDDVHNQAKLDFECYWGGSATRRPADEPPTCVPDGVARKLDSTWSRAEKSLQADRMRAEADADHEGRMRNITFEQERSRQFEKKRAEAVRILNLRAARQPSPLGPSPFGRTVPRYRQGSPAVRSNV